MIIQFVKKWWRNFRIGKKTAEKTMPSPEQGRWLKQKLSSSMG
jgi:hypothetical protein